MQIREGVQVFTADGDRVGVVDRVVVDPASKDVTHLVVRKGVLFIEDKVIPMDKVHIVLEDRVTLREDVGDLNELPDFEESYFVPFEPGLVTEPRATGQVQPQPLYAYPPMGVWSMINFGVAAPRYVTRTKQNIPKGTVALEVGAAVIGSGGEKIGTITSVFADPSTDRVTHILVTDGLLLKEKKLIPTTWLTNVLEDEVHLSVNSDFVEKLPEYQA